MSATDVDIANQALIEMGMDTITSLDEQNRTARTMRQLFDRTRDKVNAMQHWGFAITHAALAESPEYSKGEAVEGQWYESRFPLPSDYLKLMAVQYCSRYRVVGKSIVADAGAPLRIAYIQRIEDIGKWPVLVADVVAANLAMSSALRLTGQRQVRRSMQDWYTAALAEARFQHSHEHSVETFDADIWLQSRRQHA